MKTPRTLLSIASIVTLTTCASLANADERAECAKAYEQTQRLRQEGSMVHALEDADRCAQASCPDLLRNECTTWSKELRGSVAHVVVHVRGGDGCASERASILASPHARRDRDEWLVDPGVQELTVSDPASSVATKKVKFDLRPGERREIDVDFAGPNATCSKDGGGSSGSGSSRRIPLASVGLGSVGLGFVVLGGALGIIGAGKRSDLDECKPNCSQERLDGVKPYFVIGDTVAAIGLVAIGAAIAVYFAASSSPVRPTASGFAVTF